MELGGVRNAGFQIDSLAAHHGLVNMIAPQRLLCLVAHKCQRLWLKPPAGQNDCPALNAAQLHIQFDRVRDDGQTLFLLEFFCQI